ncbi:putative nuclease HARBI1 [Chelonus insularis]|uniref:putative nuclease HARBI1 n=1 Tax=Chelonus insularis TaxID=460826 RepID=UPI00158F06BC|nr:putative nuclease HARBI1 [Chelonus insularis]
MEYLGVTMVCRVAVEVMCEPCDSDSDDNDVLVSCFGGNQQGERIVRVLGYVENIVPLMSDDTFKSHFRVKRSTVNYLINLLGPDLRNDNMGRDSIPVYKQVLLVLWTMATPDSYRSVCDRFDVGKGTAWRAVWKFVSALYKYLPTFITWPTQAEAARTASYIENRYRFPKVIGAVDGTHVKICKPQINAHHYINRKGQNNLNLITIFTRMDWLLSPICGVVVTDSYQYWVTCDHTLKFIHVYCGEVGSVHDSRVFGLSGLQSLCTPANFPGNTHLLADKAYNLQPCVMVPYMNNHHLGAAEINYNRIHSSSRMMVERAIGMLKGRFRSL